MELKKSVDVDVVVVGTFVPPELSLPVEETSTLS